MNHPLTGLKVLDLSIYLPGPLCTQLLADYGAEIIKVENPKGGDPGRYVPPLMDDLSARFYSVNRNKKSIAIDLKSDEGKEIFKKLVAQSDVVIDQFRPGVMDKLGVGYECLKTVNERIIYCAISGYGLDGPLRLTAGHDLNYLSIAGVTEQIGPSDKPSMCGVQIADIASGSLFAVIAILLAVASREKTGKGQLCDVSMFDGAISLLTFGLAEWSGFGRLPERGNELLTGGYAFYNIYKTKDDKFVSLGAIEEKFWEGFCKKIGREEYIPLQYDKDKHPDMIQDIGNIMMKKTRDEWVNFFSTEDICFAPVLTMEEMSAHPHVKARNMVTKLSNLKNTGKDMYLTGVPVKLSETPGEAKFSFPLLGEHTEEILLTADYSKEEIISFVEKGVIGIYINQ